MIFKESMYILNINSNVYTFLSFLVFFFFSIQEPNSVFVSF